MARPIRLPLRFVVLDVVGAVAAAIGAFAFHAEAVPPALVALRWWLVAGGVVLMLCGLVGVLKSLAAQARRT